MGPVERMAGKQYRLRLCTVLLSPVLHRMFSRILTTAPLPESASLPTSKTWFSSSNYTALEGIGDIRARAEQVLHIVIRCEQETISHRHHPSRHHHHNPSQFLSQDYSPNRCPNHCR